jgi:hypothetical protein
VDTTASSEIMGVIQRALEGKAGMELLEMARGYLGAEGYRVNTRGRDLLIGRREGVAEQEERVYVWILPDTGATDFGSQEQPLYRRILSASDEDPSAARICLGPTLGGLSRDFRGDAQKWANVSFRTPVQFFDTDLKSDRDPRAASATRQLTMRGHSFARTRVPQPFEVVQAPSDDNEAGGPDLLETLESRLLTRRDSPTIHVVVGPAGMGKSVLFESLYSRLHDGFVTRKRELELSPRPFAILPEYLGDAAGRSVRALIDAYLRTEPARPLSRDLLDWKLTNGLATLLLDGIDEILEHDHEFFDEHMMDLVTTPNSVSSVVMCVREALFSTYDGLRQFCDEYSDYVTVYRLSEWKRDSKRLFAKNVLRGDADEFISMLEGSESLTELASTPLYCKFLADEFAGGAFPEIEPGHDFLERDLLGRAVASTVDRERDKGLIGTISQRGAFEFMEAVAAKGFSSGLRAIEVDDAREYAQLVAPDLANQREIDRAVTELTQMAVFTRGGDDDVADSGSLRFAQEPVEHFLVASYFAKRFLEAPERFVREVSRQALPDDVVRFVSDELSARGVRDDAATRLLDDTLGGGVPRPGGLRIAIRLADGTDLLRRSGVRFDGVDLTGVIFADQDLGGVSFDGSNLTGAAFNKCDLSGASFNGCLLRGTSFATSAGSLGQAVFDNLDRFYSADFGDGVVDDVREAQRSIVRLNGSRSEKLGPCASALQLRHLFNKFVAPSNVARRSWLERRAALSGKRFVRPEPVLDEAIRSGYFSEDHNRNRITRTQGDLYTEFVEFATHLALSEGIRSLLDEVCPDRDCAHAP